jgi:uncharacterized protein YggE
MNTFFEGGLGKTLVIIGIVFLATLTLGQVQGLRYIGAGIAAANTISITGHGEALAVPDIATFSFSIVSDKTTVAAAQTDATAKINAVTDYLTQAGIDKKDIQTSDYSVQPQYDYIQGVCANGYCPPGRQVLKGYEVRQTTTIKVRDTAKAGDLLAGVGGKGATEVSGLQFTFDNPTAVQTDARTKAIADAKSKADTLAKELGVSLVRVVSFNENSGGVPQPMVAYGLGGGVSASKAVSPEISTGQNKVTDDVSITYEIK